MKKKQSIIVLILSLALTVLLGFTVIRGWGPTGTGSMGNIRTGLDLSGGVSITYQAVEANPSRKIWTIPSTNWNSVCSSTAMRLWSISRD